MAKNNLKDLSNKSKMLDTSKLDEFDIYNSSLDNIDFSDDLDTDASSNRSPIERTRKGVATALKAAYRMVMPNIINRTKSIMPNTAALIDDIRTFRDDAEYLRTDFTNQIQPSITSLKRSGRALDSKVKSVLPPSLASRYDELVRDKDENDSASLYKIPSKEELRDTSIAAELDVIFKKQSRKQEKQYIEDKYDTIKEKLIDRSLDNKRSSDQLLVLENIRVATEFSANFNKNIYLNYLKKDLTLKYKHLFVAQDTLSSVQALAKISEDKLAAIVHNTALPDIQKQRATEALKQASYEKYSELAREKLSNIGKKVLTNASKNILDKFKSGLEMAAMGADMYSMTAEMDDRSDSQKKIDLITKMGQMAGSFVTGDNVNTVGKKVFGDKFNAKALVPGMKNIDNMVGAATLKGKQRLINLSENADYGSFSGQALTTLAEELGLTGLNRTGGYIRDSIGVNAPNEPAIYDNQTRTTLLEIIPGYLAKITKNTEDTAKGIGYTDSEELVFDNKKRDFVSVSSFKQDLKDLNIGNKETFSYDLQSQLGKLRGTYLYSVGEESATNFDDLKKEIAKFIINLGIAQRTFEIGIIKQYAEYGYYALEKESYKNYIRDAFDGIGNSNEDDNNPLYLSTKRKVASLLVAMVTNKEGLVDPILSSEITNLLASSSNLNSQEYIRNLSKYVSGYGQARYLDEITTKKGDDYYFSKEQLRDVRLSGLDIDKYGSYETSSKYGKKNIETNYEDLENTFKIKDAILNSKVGQFGKKVYSNLGQFSNIKDEFNLTSLRSKFRSPEQIKKDLQEFIKNIDSSKPLKEQILNSEKLQGIDKQYLLNLIPEEILNKTEELSEEFDKKYKKLNDTEFIKNIKDKYSILIENKSVNDIKNQYEQFIDPEKNNKVTDFIKNKIGTLKTTNSKKQQEIYELLQTVTTKGLTKRNIDEIKRKINNINIKDVPESLKQIYTTICTYVIENDKLNLNNEDLQNSKQQLFESFSELYDKQEKNKNTNIKEETDKKKENNLSKTILSLLDTKNLTSGIIRPGDMQGDGKRDTVYEESLKEKELDKERAKEEREEQIIKLLSNISTSSEDSRKLLDDRLEDTSLVEKAINMLTGPILGSAMKFLGPFGSILKGGYKVLRYVVPPLISGIVSNPILSATLFAAAGGAAAISAVTTAVQDSSSKKEKMIVDPKMSAHGLNIQTVKERSDMKVQSEVDKNIGYMSQDFSGRGNEKYEKFTAKRAELYGISEKGSTSSASLFGISFWSTNHIKLMEELEDALYETMMGTDTKNVVLTESQFKYFTDAFGFDPNNKQHVKYFKIWIYDRVYPIFKEYLNILNNTNNVATDPYRVQYLSEPLLEQIQSKLEQVSSAILSSNDVINVTPYQESYNKFLSKLESTNVPKIIDSITEKNKDFHDKIKQKEEEIKKKQEEDKKNREEIDKKKTEEEKKIREAQNKNLAVDGDKRLITDKSTINNGVNLSTEERIKLGQQTQERITIGADGASSTSSYIPDTGKVSVTKGEGGVADSLPDVKGKGKDAVTPLLQAVSKMTGVDFNALLAFAGIESTYNPNLGSSSSSAKGMFQFIKGTWDSMLQKYGAKYGISPGTSPMDVKANSLMGAEYLKENAEIFRKQFNREPTIAELYAMHMNGAGGGISVMKANEKDPNVPIDKVVSKSALNSNPNVYYHDPKTKKRPKTASELMAFYASKVASFLGGGMGLAGAAITTAAKAAGTLMNKPTLSDEKYTQYDSQSTSGSMSDRSRENSSSGSLIADPSMTKTYNNTSESGPISTSSSGYGQQYGSTYSSSSQVGENAPVSEKAKEAIGKLTVDRGINVEGVHPGLLQNLQAMSDETIQKTGQNFRVTSGYRSIAKQEQLYNDYLRGKGNKAAKPGNSMHNFGLAVDIKPDSLINKINSIGLLDKYGLTRPDPSEDWHVEPAGIPREKIRQNRDTALARSEGLVSVKEEASSNPNEIDPPELEGDKSGEKEKAQLSKEGPSATSTNPLFKDSDLLLSSTSQDKNKQNTEYPRLSTNTPNLNNPSAGDNKSIESYKTESLKQQTRSVNANTSSVPISDPILKELLTKMSETNDNIVKLVESQKVLTTINESLQTGFKSVNSSVGEMVASNKENLKYLSASSSSSSSTTSTVNTPRNLAPIKPVINAAKPSRSSTTV